MNLIELPVNLLDDIETVAFLFLLAKVAKWKLGGWQGKSYWFFISLGLLAFVGRALYTAAFLPE